AIATLDEVSDGRAVLGLGAGVSGFREMGVDASRSALAIREAVTLIRGLLAGQTVTVKGEQVSFTDGRLDVRAPRADVPIYVASQREAGCRVAGRIADGAIMQGCVADALLRFFKERVAEGARRAGRDAGGIELVARINVCIADDADAARDGIGQLMVYPLGLEGNIAATIERVQTEVMPQVRRNLERS